tara:strand:+ start:129 stop:1460 length:1332 start_codon:yes stop_codon:yes gene_type:complete
VHIFRLIFLFFVPLISQNNDIKVQTLDSAKIQLYLDSLLDKQSSITSEYHLKSYDIINHNSSYKIMDLGKVADSLILICDNHFNDQMIKYILKPFKNIFIGKQYSLSSRDLLAKYYFINKMPSFQYRLFGEQKLAALIFLMPDFNSYLTGSFGLSKTNNQFDLIGEMDLDIENFSGNAEQLKIFWEKNKNTSQKIKLKTFYPHIFGSEIGTLFEYEFENFNAFFTRSEKKIMLHTFLPILNNFKVGYLRGKIFSTKSGQESGYKNGDFLAISLHSEFDQRNDRLFPSLGKYFKFLVDGGLDEKTMYLKTNFEYQLFSHIFRNTYTKIQTSSYTINYLEEPIPKSRYFKLGGSSSLRGFNEQSILKPQFHIITFEIIQQQKRTFQVKSFIDLGSDKFTNFKEYLYGYGFGIKHANDKIIYSINYSLSSRKWESGKIHFKWSARL